MLMRNSRMILKKRKQMKKDRGTGICSFSVASSSALDKKLSQYRVSKVAKNTRFNRTLRNIVSKLGYCKYIRRHLAWHTIATVCVTQGLLLPGYSKLPDCHNVEATFIYGKFS